MALGGSYASFAGGDGDIDHIAAEEGSLTSGSFTFAGASTIADNDVGGSVVFDGALMPGGMLDGGNSTISNGKLRVMEV